MATNNPVVIAGQIDDSLLMEAIDKLVQDVANKADAMAQGFQEGINKMDSAMATFATNQQTHINTITQAWSGLATSFTQMQTAQQNATRPRTANSGNQSQSSTNDDTIAGIKQRIKEEKKVLDVQKLETEETRKQANLVGDLQKRLAYNTKPRYTLPEVLGMDTSTIDQITQKMAALRKVEFDPKDATTAAKIRDEYQKLAEQKRKLMGVNSQLENSNKSLASAFNYIRNRIVYAFTIGTITGFVKDLIKVRQEYELLERSIGILTGSMEKGTQIFNELSEMALKSPFTLVELGTAAKQLSAYNFAASEVVDTTRRLADISAALGVPMERLVYNLGQIKAQGVLNARDARDFANAGFAIVPMLAQLYTKQKMFGEEIVTTSKVYDMMSKKLVTYGDVMRVIESATDEGGKFFDYQAKQADTLKVQYANLALAYNNMLNDIGTEHQDLLSAPVKVLKVLFQNWKELVRIINTVIVSIGAYKLASIAAMSTGELGWRNMIATILKAYRAIRNATSATEAFNAVTKLNAWGAIASVVAAVVGYLVLFNSETEKASVEVEMFGESSAKAISNLKTLGKILNASNENSTVYKKSIEELNRVIGEYGIEEIKTRDEINTKIEKTIQLIQEEAAERQRANQLSLGKENYENAVSDAKKEFVESLGGSFWKSLALPQDVYDKFKNDAAALGQIIPGIIDDNIELIRGKKGKELAEGFGSLSKKVQERLKAIGYNEREIGYIFAKGGLDGSVAQYARAVALASTNLDDFNNKIELNYQAAQKSSNSMMTSTEKMKANEKALLALSGDAKVMYDRIVDLVKLAKSKYSFDFDLNFNTADIPKWMLDKPEEELTKLAARFTAIAQSGMHAEGYTVEETYKRGLLYMEAARKKAEDAERRTKDTNKKQKKDVLGEALTKEIQLINEAQKRYSEYRKMGLSATDAQLKVSEEYNKSLANVSNTLAKFGIATKPMKELAYMNSRELKAYFQTLLDGATRLGNAKGIEAAEKAIANLNVEITKLDTKKITDGLNNDLSKLKDEYELQVELDATSGLGDALTDLLGIDTSDFPQTFEEYMSKVNQAFDKYRLEMSQWDSPWDVFKMSNKDVQDWGKRFGLDDETVKKVETAVKSQQDTYKKYVQDMVKNANSLEYELSDTAGKIAIKEKELADTREKRNKATTDIERKYLDLTIQNQEKAIAELRAQALALLPEYDRVFGSIAEHSASVARKLQKDLLSVFDNATYDASSKSYTLTGKGGQTAILNEEQYTKERNKLIKEMRKSQSSIQKIKEAFSPSDKNDVVDYARGIELIGQELTKLGELVGAIGNITQALGMNEDATESINDVSETLKGLGQAAQGYAKIQSGDIIGGATDMITGTFTAISAWLDNSDKKIQRSIKNSEMAVKRLELAYKDLQYAIEDAFGTAKVGAEKEALANKQLQLIEVQRQIALQESRTGKNRDEEAILNLKSQEKELQREIQKGYEGIINNLLGISDVGSAVENMVQSVANALRNGENAIDAWNTSIDDMIANTIMQFVSAQVVGPMFQKVIDDMTKTVAQRGADTVKELEEVKKQRDAKQAEVDEWSALYNKYGDRFGNIYGKRLSGLQDELKDLNNQVVELEDQAKQQTEFTKQDLEYMVEHLAELKANGGDWMSYLQELLEKYGLMGGANESQLSNLQQGIQGITETTAGALEAYCNNMLTQIYVQVGIQSRMLLELQNSYQIQAAIHAILTGVVNANGMAFRVELTD